MAKIGRNQPCPCGSGEKAKRCCLRWSGPLPDGQAPGRALVWLREHYEEAMQEAFREDFLGNLENDELERLDHLSEGLRNMLDVNGWELVLAEGGLELERGRVGCLDVVFSAGGPLFDAGQRAYLKKMGREPLCLCEVVESHPGAGIRLRDLLDGTQPLKWVRELAASQSLSSGDVIAARLIPGPPWTLSGAIYGYREHVVHSLLGQLRQELKDQPDPRLERPIRSAVLVDAWLKFLTMPPPTLVDASTGEAFLLVSDHYRVLDWDRLEASLAAQPDARGDRRHGWARVEDPAAEMSRPRLAIEPEGKDRVEVSFRTRTLADEGKAWFEGVAGDAVAWITREITDPASLWDRRFDAADRRPVASRHSIDPSELPADFHQQVHEQIYRDWADEPLPALGDRTPRQALATREGSRRVLDLLESYERGERKNARQEKRSPVDYGFLWRELDLERPPIDPA